MKPCFNLSLVQLLVTFFGVVWLNASITAYACKDQTYNIDMYACDSYFVGGNLQTVSGLYTDIYTGFEGCDSIINTQLTITPNNLDVSVTIGNATFFANASGATYQWLDCDNVNTAIPGATEQAFTPGDLGNYAVIISQGACADTSDCINLFTVGIPTSPLTQIELVPNPSTGVFTLHQIGQNDLTIKVFDMLGQLVQTIAFKRNGQAAPIINLVNCPNGNYTVQIRDAQGAMVIKRVVLLS